MFELDLVWWEFILRGIIVYVVLLAIVRIAGKRTIGQFTPFDLLVVMLLSEAVGTSMVGGDQSIAGGLIVAITLIALNVAVSFLASRNQRMEVLLEGREVLLGRNGQIFDDVLKKHRIGRNEIDHALHAANISLEDMTFLILETDGTINALSKK